MIYFVVPREQEFGIGNYLKYWGPDLVGLVSILHYEELPGRTSLPAGTYIFCALDQLTPGGLRLVRELQRQLRASPAVGRTLNDPDTALLRFDLLEELFRQGLNWHRAVRATGELGALRFPVFLREELEHSGSLSPLLRTRSELQRALGRVVLQGYRLKELLVVEFCDTADAEGRYRKYSAYRVGSAIISRGMARGRDWMLKAEGITFSEDMLLEERAYALANPYEDQLRRIFALSGIEFGRIDFAVKDGVVETWEINTNPTIGPGPVDTTPEQWRPLRQPMREHFNRHFRAALGAMGGPVSSRSIAVSYSAESLRGASPIVRPPRTRGTLGRIARALPPLRPLLAGTARFISPLVAWAARLRLTGRGQMTRTLTLLALGGLACREAQVSGTPEWRLSEEPTLSIGAEGVAEREFHRVAGAVRLGSGQIAVANRGTNEVRFFAPGGDYLGTFGREGSGPGEFRSMGRLIRFGDTLAIHDTRNDRLTVFLGTGLLDTRVVRSPNAVHSFSINDRLSDGRWVVGTSVSPRFSTHPYRDSIAVGILPASAEGTVQWLGWFPGPWIASIEGKITGPAGFFTWVHPAVAGHQVVVLDGDQQRLRRFSPDGTESPGGEISIRGQPLTPEIIEQARRRETNPQMGQAEQDQWLDVKYGAQVLGDRLPAFRSVLADSEGLIWLEGYRTDEHEPGRYFVFSVDVAPVATVVVPAGFRATDIGPEYLLGVATDADGVERIVMYRLNRT